MANNKDNRVETNKKLTVGLAIEAVINLVRVCLRQLRRVTPPDRHLASPHLDGKEDNET